MELLAGTRTPAEYAKLRARLLPFPLLRLRSLSDFEKAADLYRTCRREGETVRRLIDCLIAAVAIRERATVLRDMAGFAPRGSAMRLLCAAGARPNFVKIAPILEAAAVPGVEALLKRVDNHADHALVT